MTSVLALLLGAAGGVGAAFVLAALSGHGALIERIGPYVATGRLAAGRRRRSPGVRSLLTDWWQAAAQALGRALGGNDRLAGRLTDAGWPRDTASFRSRQLAWAIAGLAAGFLLALGLMRARGLPLPLALVLAGAGAAGGAIALEQQLSRAVRRRRSAMLAELPALAELLALAVAAGDSVHGALSRVAGSASGAAAAQLRGIVAAVAGGATLTDALDQAAATTSLRPMAALLDAVATALERGTPLADVLQAQALDIREAGRRSLLEAGGRKEIAMMIPVVFLILPVTVLFAVFPGLIALKLIV